MKKLPWPWVNPPLITGVLGANASRYQYGDREIHHAKIGIKCPPPLLPHDEQPRSWQRIIERGGVLPESETWLAVESRFLNPLIEALLTAKGWFEKPSIPEDWPYVPTRFEVAVNGGGVWCRFEFRDTVSRHGGELKGVWFEHGPATGEPPQQRDDWETSPPPPGWITCLLSHREARVLGRLLVEAADRAEGGEREEINNPITHEPPDEGA